MHAVLLIFFLFSFIIYACCFDERLGHLQPFGEQGPKLSIDETDVDIAPREFFANYVNKSKPLLMKGAAKHSPAWHLWTDEYLMSLTIDGPAGTVVVEQGKKENRSSGTYDIPFKEFLQIYNTTDIYMVDDVPFYMLQDLVIPFPLQCHTITLDLHVMWFSSGGTSSVVHNDGYENINCLFRGSKKLVFVNTTKYIDLKNEILTNVEKSFSDNINVDRIDLDKTPFYAGLEYHHVTMNAGDCLFIPSEWIHQVRSFGTNLAANVWWYNDNNPDKCLTQISKKMTFDKVTFTSLIRAMQIDVENIFDYLLKNGIRKKKDLVLLAANKNTELTGVNNEFYYQLRDIFHYFDKNRDSSLTEEDNNVNFMLKNFKRLFSAINNYNTFVYKFRQAAKTKENLPLYFYCARGTNIFSLENSMAYYHNGEPKNLQAKKIINEEL